MTDIGTRKGEEFGTGNEAGREHSAEHPDDHLPGRTARDATSINPDKREPIDPSMPHMPPA
jgi:hypothetical protein